MSEVDTSAEAVDRVMFGLRPMNGSNEMDAGVAMIEAIVSERDTLRAQLATARADALEEAADAVHMECWTDGVGGEVTPELMAEQATTSLAITAIRALKETTPQEKK